VTRRLLLLIPVAAALAFVIAIAVLRPPAPPRAPHRFALGRGSTIALLHGPGGSIQDWLPVARLLAKSHRVVLVELPGHSLSPLPEPFTLERAAAALHAMLEAESKEPVVLVGHGVGGLVAALEAAEHPERVRALVLIETALRPQTEGEEQRELLEAVDLDYPRLLRRIYLGYGRDSAQGAMLHARAARMAPSSLRPWLSLGLIADVSLRMRHLRPPLLAIFSQRLWPVERTWPEVAEPLGYPVTPNARSARVEGTGHFLMLDRPEEIARLIQHFAEDSSRGAVAAR
jgi:pimeloyl-ACP methyl ester carboxylesterase